jgi:hypothetical protein
MKRTIALLALVVSLSARATATSSPPTPLPGGANQASGVAGTFGQKLFNGEVRLIPREIRDANDSDNVTAASGQKWIVFTASASNGTAHALDMQQFTASIVDSDGDSIQAQPDKVKPMGGVFGVPPGAQWKEQVLFVVPADFIPAKLVLLPNDRKHPAFRITVRVADYAHT